MKKQTVVTHSGGFHSDDVFAVAAFQLLLGVDDVEVIRTRDNEVIEKGDYVVDVGEVYDHEKKRYDHHQNGAPVRENGIAYAGFGLMWRHYGSTICGDERVADMIDERLCQPIDAGDNGQSLCEYTHESVRPYELFMITSSFKPLRSSTSEVELEAFMQAVTFARGLLERTIAHAKESIRLEVLAEEIYRTAADKRVLVLPESMSENYFLAYDEVEAVVYPSHDEHRGQVWKVGLMPVEAHSFVRKFGFPKAWLGLRDEELAGASGIADAIFCHKGSFRFVALSKEGALKATESLVPTEM